MSLKEWFNLKDYKNSPDILVGHGSGKALYKRLHVEHKHSGGFDLSFAPKGWEHLQQLASNYFCKIPF